MRRPSKAVSTSALLFLGLVLVCMTASVEHLYRSFDDVGFVMCMIAAGGVAILATAVARFAHPKWAVGIVVFVAIAIRMIAMMSEPLTSTDVYRYVWDGRVQGAGINPYRYIPADDVLRAFRDKVIYPLINRADYAHTAYPPFAQMFFYGVTRVADSLSAMRVAVTLCDLLTMVLLMRILVRASRPAALVVSYAWHPLVVWEIANGGHLDGLATVLVVGALFTLSGGKYIKGAVLVACSVLVKPYTAVLLPIFWRPWDWRAPLVVIAVIAALYLPYISVGAAVIGFVPTYFHEEGLDNGQAFWLLSVVRYFAGQIGGLQLAYISLGLAAFGLITFNIVSGPRTSKLESVFRHAFLLLAVGLFFLSPNYPWYFLPLVPFTVLGGGAVAWVMTLGAELLHLSWPDPSQPAARFLIWKTAMNIAVLLAVAWTIVNALKKRRRGRQLLTEASPIDHGLILGLPDSKNMREFLIARNEMKFDGGEEIVSVVIPCLNEEEAIGPLVGEVLAAGVDEVVVVDNGCSDRTADNARLAGARVVTEPMAGYGRACAAGVRGVREDCNIICFMDGDGSDSPRFLASIIGPLASSSADFVMGSRVRGIQEPGSMTPQQILAGRIAGRLLKAAYGVRFTDMSPYRAIRTSSLRELGMQEMTYGWNLEMQMRVAASGMRILEIPVDCRRRRGGVSKVSGNLAAGINAAWKISTTFLRLWFGLKKNSQDRTNY